MSDPLPPLPPWYQVFTEGQSELRREFGDKVDRLGGEIAEERKARELADKEIRSDVDEIKGDVQEVATSRLRSASAWMKAIIIGGVLAIISGCITLVVFYVEAQSHLSGGSH